MSKHEPRIFGYAHACEHEQVKPAESQAEAIRQKAKELEGLWVRCRIDLAPWASKVPHQKRPEFKKLMDELDRGDCLIVWRLDRIDGNPFRLAEAIGFLVNRQVRLYVLDFGRLEMDLNGAAGEVLVTVMTTVADMFRFQRQAAIKRELQRRKASGLAYTRYPPLGMKRVVHKGLKMDVWDEAQCQLIRQIKARRDAGESMAQIGEDFYAKRLKTASGKLWVKPYGRKGRLNLNRLYRAYQWYSELLAKGEDLWGIPAVPVPNRFAGPIGSASGE